MKVTQVISDKRVFEYLKDGVDAIVTPVSKTLGPEAGTTLMYRTYNRGPRNVDDGFYTAEVITPKNPFVRLVAEFFKEATMRTNRKVGDGTSATTVIAGALFKHIYDKLQKKAQGYSSSKKETTGVMQLKKDILREANVIKSKIKEVAKPVKDLKELEKISAISLGEDNEISKTIAKMAWEVGTDGFIDVVEGYKGELETEIVKGMRFHAKSCGKAFINKPERYEMVVEDCPVLITNYKMDNDMLMRYIVQKSENTKLIVIAPDFSDQVLVNMVLARENGTFVYPVKASSLRTEVMEDIAVYCGAKLFDKNKGDKLTSFDKKDLGYLEKLVVKDTEAKEDAIALGGLGTREQQFVERTKGKTEKTITSTAIKERIKVLKGQLEETKEQQFKMLMERRIASMSSAGGIIRVGSPTDAESLPLKLKIEDDVFACRAALRSGYVKGGGLCLKEIADTLPDNHILKSALLAPYNQIQENAGGIEIGKDVIDPADAVYYAVEHATSVVASMITIKTLVVDEPEIPQGEGEKETAQAIKKFAYYWAKEKNILSENEKLMEQDSRGGLTEDEMLSLDNS